MRTIARGFALSAALAGAGCTSTESTGDDAAECFAAKCDGFGGAEVLGALSDDAVKNPPGQPVGFTAFGTKALFWGSTLRGLWITDGTPDGTKLVRDIGPVHDYGEPPAFAVVGTTAMWTHQGAVWITDGTPAGTTTIMDIGANRYQYLGDPVAFGGKFLFNAESKLYISDGTAAGTSVLADVNAYLAASEMGGKLYFGCSTPATGYEVCVTDGTPAGTKVVADLGTGTSGISPRFLGAIDGKLLFSAEVNVDREQRSLWATDGTTAGTTQLVAARALGDVVSEYATAAVLGGQLYFTCHSDSAGSELCKSDGTAAGTSVLDIVAGTGDVAPTDLVAAGDRLYFIGKQQGTGRELWSSDGTVAGTAMLFETSPGIFDGAYGPLVPLGDRVVFGGKTANYHDELFISDGTAAGTTQVGDIQKATSGGYGLRLTYSVVLGDKIVFAAEDGTHGQEPWVSDGTEAGTMMLADVGRPTTGARPLSSKTFGTGSYFAVEDSDATLIWRSNGVAEGTTKLVGLERQFSSGFATVGSSLYFGGWSSLWKSDGTPAGTKKVRDMPGNIGELTALGNRLAFTGSTTSQTRGLWVSDGTAAGTVETGAINAERLAAASGRLWLTALDGSAGNELFTSDGTVAGTRHVAEIHANGSSKPTGFVGLGGKTLFSATSAPAGSELFITDGTFAGTKLVKDINPGTAGANPYGMTAFKNKVVFWAAPSAAGYELWQSDGTGPGTSRLAPVAMAANFPSANIGQFVVWGDHVFFIAKDDGGNELWRSDGTEAGTVRVADIYAGPMSSNPSDLVLAGPDGPLYFVAEEPAGGREPWKLATPTGTPARFADVRPGPGSSKPSHLQTRGDSLLFLAEGDSGATLFRLGPAPDVVAPTIKCPDDLEVEADEATGATVTFAAPTASDNDGDATIETSVVTGDLFSVGTTTVTATATDSAGNTASCTFDVTVTFMGAGGGGGGGTGSGSGGAGGDDPEVDDGGGGCSATNSAAAPASFGLILFAMALLRRRRGAR